MLNYFNLGLASDRELHSYYGGYEPRRTLV
jgi:hypothetical protein